MDNIDFLHVKSICLTLTLSPFAAWLVSNPSQRVEVKRVGVMEARKALLWHNIAELTEPQLEIRQLLCAATKGTEPSPSPSPPSAPWRASWHSGAVSCIGVTEETRPRERRSPHRRATPLHPSTSQASVDIYGVGRIWGNKWDEGYTI
jgi:hypothetical protein